MGCNCKGKKAPDARAVARQQEIAQRRAEIKSAKQSLYNAGVKHPRGV